MLGLFVIAAGVILTNKAIICRMVYWFEVLHKPMLQIFHALIYSSVHFKKQIFIEHLWGSVLRATDTCTTRALLLQGFYILVEENTNKFTDH